MGAPVPRMPRPPHPHPLHVLRAAEVIPVLGFAQPAALPRRLAGGPAGALRAVLLPSTIAHIDGENIPAAQAFALYFVCHGSPARGPIFAHRGRPPPNPVSALTSRAKTDAE